MARLVLLAPALALVLPACGGAAARPAEPAVAHAHAAGLALTDAGLLGLPAPIDAKTRATLAELRTLLAPAGLSVAPDGKDASFVLDVSRGPTRLFYVVPNDDGSLFNVHVVSPEIASPRGWRVGGSLLDAASLACECWGTEGDEVAACYHVGEHVAVVYDRACSAMKLDDARNRKVLDGATIARLVWQPEPWKPPVPGPEPAPGDSADDDADGSAGSAEPPTGD